MLPNFNGSRNKTAAANIRKKNNVLAGGWVCGFSIKSIALLVEPENKNQLRIMNWEL
jgi:hypothetical protein